MTKLNIGAGDTVIPGFIAIDRKLGTEAFPLDYPDNSVEEIRASHILEHFSFDDAQKALDEWTRVLTPGGRLRVAVPDIDYCSNSSDPNRVFWLMGGQTDSDNFHRSAYDKPRLTAVMEQAGLHSLNPWHSENTDAAALDCSLNMEGFKPGGDPAGDGPVTEQDLQISAFMTLPRYESVAARSIIESSCRQLGIGLATSQGVFWGQCMQRMFQDAVDQDVDWILSIDSDSVFSPEQLSQLMVEFASYPEADAMAALQCRRGKPFPLMTAGHQQEIKLTNRDPILCTSAHFGLTLIRVEDLKRVPKPWFFAEPGKDGDWDEDRLDDDIWFWHQWRKAGKTLYVTPRVSIGHIEETVAVFDDKFQARHTYIADWREENLKP